jgi:hypothetical protein
MTTFGTADQRSVQVLIVTQVCAPRAEAETIRIPLAGFDLS